MDSSTRLYTRLGKIPDDPGDPESLEDLLVCAFGAFERYYVCWKTRGGEYRQDGYDLPVGLRDWLYPTDGTTRDFATLQVVFGRGEEYFASDQYSKLEYKEPEPKKPKEEGEGTEKRPLRRSRTVSFLRPLSGTSTKSDGSATESVASRRSSSISSVRASRPMSLSYFAMSSDASTLSEAPTQTQSALPTHTSSQPSVDAQLATPSTSAADLNRPSSLVKGNDRLSVPILEAAPKDTPTDPPIPAPTQAVKRPQPLNIPPKRTSFSKQSQSSQSIARYSSTNKITSSCSCGCHDKPSRSTSKSVYADASAQTDPILSPSGIALGMDTSSLCWPFYTGYGAASQGVEISTQEESSSTNPIFIRGMIDYFSSPSYQLGDSLISR